MKRNIMKGTEQMKDRFKFRAWDSISKEYIVDSYAQYELLVNDDDSYQIEQCTGLKDKNGKLIYEGDILNIKYRAASDLPQINIFKGNSVEYDNNKAEYSISTTIGKRKENISLSSLIGEESDISVIGNIHENPELLEK